MLRKMKPIYWLMFVVFLTPNPNVSFSKFLPVLSIGFITLYLTVGRLKEESLGSTFKKINKKTCPACIIFALYFLWEILLFLFQPKSISNFSYIFRPVYFLMIFLSAYLISKPEKYEELFLDLKKGFYAIFYFQIIVVILQLFDVNIFSYLYEDSKAFPLSFLVRVTGTFSNPNIFAWIITQIVLVLTLLETRKFMRIITYISGMILVVFSGSRTMLLVAPTILFFSYALKSYIENENKAVILRSVFGLLLLLIAIFIFLKSTENIFPYASQILNIFRGGLSQINSFNRRVIKWNEFIQVLKNNNSYLLTGTLSANYADMDNDILYGISRSGLFGLVLQYLGYISTLLWTVKDLQLSHENVNIVTFLISYLLFSFVVGLQAETLTGWIYPVMYFFTLGIFRGGLETDDRNNSCD